MWKCLYGNQNKKPLWKATLSDWKFQEYFFLLSCPKLIIYAVRNTHLYNNWIIHTIDTIFKKPWLEKINFSLFPHNLVWICRKSLWGPETLSLAKWNYNTWNSLWGIILHFPRLTQYLSQPKIIYQVVMNLAADTQEFVWFVCACHITGNVVFK